MPLTAFSYDTTDTYGSFLTGQLLNSLFAAAGQGIVIFFLTAAAEPLYRRYYANQIEIGGQFTPAGLRTKRFLLGTILGLAMTPAFLAYQVLFYITAEQFGAWSPADIPYREMVNTYIPWIMVLFIVLMTAVVLHGLWLLVRRVRNEGIAWAPLIKIAAVGAAFWLLHLINGLSVVERAYDTRLTLSIFTITQVLSVVLGSLGIGLVILAALGLATSLYPDWPTRLRAARRVPEFRDAVVGVALVLVAGAAWQHLRGYIESRFIASDPSLGFGLPSKLDQYLPFLNSLSDGVTGAIFVPILAGLVLYYSRVVIKRRLYVIVVGLGAGLIMSGSNAIHFDEFLFELLTLVTTVGFIVAAIVLVLRNNLLAYGLLGFASVLSEVKSLGALSAPAYQVQAGILLLLTLGLVFGLWWYLGTGRDAR